MQKLKSDPDFAARVRGDHPDELAYREYILAELRCAHIRTKLLITEIETIGLALRVGLIDAEMAMLWLRDVNGLEFLHPQNNNSGEEKCME
jgi:hypothetical protein